MNILKRIKQLSSRVHYEEIDTFNKNEINQQILSLVTSNDVTFKYLTSQVKMRPIIQNTQMDP